MTIIQKPRITREFEAFDGKTIRPSGAYGKIDKSCISKEVAIMLGILLLLLALLTFRLAR